jgi:hypothetical protein
LKSFWTALKNNNYKVALVRPLDYTAFLDPSDEGSMVPGCDHLLLTVPTQRSGLLAQRAQVLSRKMSRAAITKYATWPMRKALPSSYDTALGKAISGSEQHVLLGAAHDSGDADRTPDSRGDAGDDASLEPSAPRMDPVPSGTRAGRARHPKSVRYPI